MSTKNFTLKMQAATGYVIDLFTGDLATPGAKPAGDAFSYVRLRAFADCYVELSNPPDGVVPAVPTGAFAPAAGAVTKVLEMGSAGQEEGIWPQPVSGTPPDGTTQGTGEAFRYLRVWSVAGGAPLTAHYR